MPQLYESVEETNTRLANSLFLYGQNLVICNGAYHPSNDSTKGIKLKLFKYPTLTEVGEVDLSDPSLEFRRYNLGYCNLPEGATFVSRFPAKGKYKQGLCQENLSFTRVYNKDNTGFAPKFAHAVQRPGFRDMMFGVYPSMAEAINLLSNPNNNGCASVAFNQYFALAFDKFRKDFILEYKGTPIAFGKGEFEIPSEFSYMRGLLLKNGIKVR